MREKIKASISKEIITPSRLLSSMESPTRGFQSKSAASPDLTRETSRLSLAATRTNATNGSSGILYDPVTLQYIVRLQAHDEAGSTRSTPILRSE